MKNLTELKNNVKCNRCLTNGFFSYTPGGADFDTCPCCGKDDFVNYSYSYHKKYI
jgi:hypothetical protein